MPHILLRMSHDIYDPAYVAHVVDNCFDNYRRWSSVASFGLKTFNADQHSIFASQLARILKPGAPFSLIEATDPLGWWLRPAYRFYIDAILPQVERIVLRGAQDFMMIGAYTKNFANGTTVTDALREAGLFVAETRLVGRSALILHGHKPPR